MRSPLPGMECTPLAQPLLPAPYYVTLNRVNRRPYVACGLYNCGRSWPFCPCRYLIIWLDAHLRTQRVR